MYLLLFLYLENQIFDIIKKNQLVFTKLPTKKDGFIRKIFIIKLLVILYSFFENQNLNILYISKFYSGLL